MKEIGRLWIEKRIPEYYQRVDTLPGDPEDSIPYATMTDCAECFLMTYPIGFEQAMPLNEQLIIEGIRNSLDEKQGIIQVEAGENFVYSIVKTLLDTGVQYTLTYHHYFEKGVLSIMGFFCEIGTTGLRDTMVYEMCRRNQCVGSQKDPFEGWNFDPYDETFVGGVLMNISEKAEYDEMFPMHPLSLCRELIMSMKNY